MGMDKDFLICGKNISTHTRLVENGLGQVTWIDSFFSNEIISVFFCFLNFVQTCFTLSFFLSFFLFSVNHDLILKLRIYKSITIHINFIRCQNSLHHRWWITKNIKTIQWLCSHLANTLAYWFASRKAWITHLQGNSFKRFLQSVRSGSINEFSMSLFKRITTLKRGCFYSNEKCARYSEA